jgi:hypothetical protein
MELAFKVVERHGVRVALCLHTINPPPQHEWDAVMHELGHAGPQSQPPRLLVVTDGGAPDAKQRSQLRDLWNGQSIKVSAIVPGYGNAVKRGVMTALSWLNANLKFFTPDEVEAALSHVDLSGELPGLWQDWLAIQRLLPPVRALRLIASESQLPWFGPEPDMKLPNEYP